MASHTMSEVVQKILGEDEKVNCEKKKCVKSVLKKLKKKEKELISELQNETSDKRSKKLSRTIKVIHAQRKKGLKTLKKM
ncbi:MAG: hypothetical protein HQL48_01055 [Gammaproteobacteria bacterium]|nr:hypothetical protein [Gammaproteobacteria bacterium]